GKHRRALICGRAGAGFNEAADEVRRKGPPSMPIDPASARLASMRPPMKFGGKPCRPVVAFQRPCGASMRPPMKFGGKGGGRGGRLRAGDAALRRPMKLGGKLLGEADPAERLAASMRPPMKFGGKNPAAHWSAFP